MKSFLTLFLILAPGACLADTFVLKDGARLEGEVASETDGALLVKTKYGTLTIGKQDVQERLTAAQPAAGPAQAASPAPEAAQAAQAQEPAPVPAAPNPAALPAAPEPVEPAPGQAAQALPAETPAVSSETAEGMVAPAPRLTFLTLPGADGSHSLSYLADGVAVATETYDSAGALLASGGSMPDGTYLEYYPDGALKTSRTMMGGKANGTVKAFYPSGALQAEASYFVGQREGSFRYLTEEGRLLMEAEYKNDKLNGWKRDYGPGGEQASAAYYRDGEPAAPPAALTPASALAAAAEELPAGADAQVTVRTVRVARGERFDFRLNGKFAGRLLLDKEYNLMDLDGKLPDGEIKAYSPDGKLQKEFVFERRELKALRVYEEGGPLRAEYVYVKDKAVKK